MIEVVHAKYLLWFIWIFGALFVFLIFHIPRILGKLEESTENSQGGEMENSKKGIFSGVWWNNFWTIAFRLFFGYCEICGEDKVSFMSGASGLCKNCAPQFPDAIKFEKKKVPLVHSEEMF